MAQCVPSWNVDDPSNPSPNLLPSSSSSHFQLSMSDNEVAELTWSNGHLLAHGLVKPTPRYPPSVTGTLESIVDQAKLLHPTPAITPANRSHISMAVDALVPTGRGHREDLALGIGSCDVSNTGGRLARVTGHKESTTIGSIESLTGVDSCGTDDFGFATTDSVTPFTTDDGIGVSRSPDTETTSYVGGGGSRPMAVVDDHDFVCHSRRSLSQREMAGEEDEKVNEECTVRSTISTKRSRAAAIHNQSERKRRDRINQKIRTLQKLVPNSNKTDKASMLDEVIEYVKQLQAQISMISRMSSMAPPMMMPMSMQQFQMSMMAQMAHMAQMAQMGMAGMGMMHMGSMGRIGPTRVAPVTPPVAFLPMNGNVGGGWDASAAATAERMQQRPAGGVNMADPFSVFVPCHTQQPMTMDAYQRMAALYQQMFQENQPTYPK